MASGDVADAVGHGQNAQAEGERDAQQPDPDLGERGRDHGAAAAREGQPEGADPLGEVFAAIYMLPLAPRIQSPECRSDGGRRAGIASLCMRLAMPTRCYTILAGSVVLNAKRDPRQGLVNASQVVCWRGLR